MAHPSCRILGAAAAVGKVRCARYENPPPDPGRDDWETGVLDSVLVALDTELPEGTARGGLRLAGRSHALCQARRGAPPFLKYIYT